MNALKLPLKYVNNNWQNTTIYDADERPICLLDLEDWDVTEENQDTLEAEQSEIVKQIVQAVNSHDALLAEIAQLKKDLNLAAELFGDVFYCVMEQGEFLVEPDDDPSMWEIQAKQLWHKYRTTKPPQETRQSEGESDA